MSDTFSSADISRYLIKRKWIVLVVAVVFGVAAYFYSTTLPIYFKSSINCVPARNDNNLMPGGGGLSSALKDFGLTKLSGSSDDSYSFIVVLFTRSIRDSMINRFQLWKEYGIDSTKMNDVRAEFESNLSVEYGPEGNYEIKLWSTDKSRAVEMCRAFVDYANVVSNHIQHADAIKASGYLRSRIGSIDSLYNVLADSLAWYSKTYKIFSPAEQSKATAAALSEIKAEILKQETMVGLLEKSYGSQDPQVKAQRELLKNLQSQFDEVIARPGLVGQLSMSDMSGMSAHFLKLTAELEGLAKLKAFLLPTLEQVQLDINKTSPSLLVVDEPIPAEKKDRPKKSLIAGGAFVGGAVLTILILLFIRIWKSFKS